MSKDFDLYCIIDNVIEYHVGLYEGSTVQHIILEAGYVTTFKNLQSEEVRIVSRSQVIKILEDLIAEESLRCELPNLYDDLEMIKKLPDEIVFQIK